MSKGETQEMLSTIRVLLRGLNYREDLIIPEYRFRGARGSETISESVSQQIDLAAFAQSPPSTRSACIGVAVSSDDTPQSIADFYSLGAPQILAIHLDTSRVTRWRMPASGLPVFLDETPFAQVEQLFDDHRSDWAPDTILRAKGIAFSPTPPQPDFIDAGYLPALEDELRDKLSRDLNNILAVCKKTYILRHSEEVFEAASASLYRLLFRLIVAKYAIDRGKQPGWRDLTASEVVREVETFFSGSTSLEPVLSDGLTQDAAWLAIRTGLNLANLSPEILAYLYENTLVSPQLRKQFGIHATPPAVAEYMVSHLPIGELRKDEQRIFEPFCGAAPFLIAGLGQLRALETRDVPPEQQHEYFQRMLVGMEISAFSREIALCSLILADDANRDSWQIISGDAFTSPDFERHLHQANIVLCNPPHETFTKAKLLKPETALYDNQAAEALHRVLMRKPPILGFVLPRAFVDGQAFHKLREEIVDAYSDVSVVTLPDNAFEKADQEVALLMAHNLGKHGKRYYSANVNEDEWEVFLRTRQPFDAYETSTLQRRQDGSAVLWHPPLHRLWDYFSSYPTLDAYAEIHKGIEYNRPVEECVFDTPQPHTQPGLQTLDNFMEAFIIRKHQHLDVDTNGLRRKKFLEKLTLPKVLVNRARSSRGWWRIAGVGDYEQLVASANFFGVWPRGDAPLELIAALISGPVINAYSYAYEGKRDNRIRVLAAAPVPHFKLEQVELIVLLVQSYASYRVQWLKKEGGDAFFIQKCLQLLWQIDAAVLEAYNLPDDLEHELLQRFEGVKRNPLPFEFSSYGGGYVLAKKSLHLQKTFIKAVQRYRELCGKKYDSILAPAELGEMQRLGQVIDAHEANSNPLYELIGAAEGGPPGGAENHDAYIYRP